MEPHVTTAGSSLVTMFGEHVTSYDYIIIFQPARTMIFVIDLVLYSMLMCMHEETSVLFNKAIQIFKNINTS